MMMAKAKKKYPDVESVLEVIRTRDEMGLPLSPGQLNRGKYPDPDLHKAGIRHCGTWQKAVEAAGFDYANVLGKAKSRYPTAASVIREIKDRHKNELPLSASDVGRNPGRHRNIALYKAALKHFGEWKSAIEVAGLDYSSIQPRRKRKYPDTDSVVGEIQCRHKAGIPLNGLAVVEGEHRDYMLHKYAQDYFGTWSAGLFAWGAISDLRERLIIANKGKENEETCLYYPDVRSFGNALCRSESGRLSEVSARRRGALNRFGNGGSAVGWVLERGCFGGCPYRKIAVHRR